MRPEVELVVTASDIPDHITLWGLRLAICQPFDQYANVRPTRVLPGITSPLRNVNDGELDWVIVRENSEGEYAGVGGRVHQGSPLEAATDVAMFTRAGVERVMLDRVGDDVAVAETQVIIGNVEGAVVKWARGFHSAQTLTPQAAQDVIRTRVASAISRIEEFEPYVLEPPIEVELSLKHYRPVELLGYLPNVERISAAVHHLA